MTKQGKIKEEMAGMVHLTWQRWMGYVLTHLDKEHIDRWTRQANTTYKDLPEYEKASDRAVADEYAQLLHSQGVVVKVERELPSMWNGKGEVKSALAYRKELASYEVVEPIMEVKDE